MMRWGSHAKIWGNCKWQKGKQVQRPGEGPSLAGLGTERKPQGLESGEVGVSWGLAGRAGWEPSQVALVGPLERGFCSSCKGVLNQRGM